MKNQKTRIGQVIRKARVERGLSLREISRNVTIPKSTLHYYEVNGLPSEFIRLLHLLRFYNFTLRYIIEDYRSLSDLELCQELLESEKFERLCKNLIKVRPEQKDKMIGSMERFLESIVD